MAHKDPQKRKEYNKTYYLNNREKFLVDAKAYRDKNKDRANLYAREYNIKNRDKIALKKKIYEKENRENISVWRKGYEALHKTRLTERRRLYRLKNKERITATIKKWNRENKVYISDYKRKYKNKNRKTNIQFKIADNLRGRLYHAIKDDAKSGSAVRDLGCTISELKFYIEGKFQDGMSWENWTRVDLHEKAWNIDHIIPLSFFDLTDRGQFLKAVHYTNLQPMWAVDNLHKYSKLPVIMK